MEILDVFDINGNFVGKKSREFCHGKNPGVYHKPVWIWVINDNKEILIQKRANNLKENSDKWDAAVAGHALAGENSLDACVRETKEEIGINTKKEDFKFIAQWINKKGWELAQIYLLTLNISKDEMELQKEEVAEIKWVTFEEFSNLLYSNKFAKFPKGYKKWIIETLMKYLNKNL